MTQASTVTRSIDKTSSSDCGAHSFDERRQAIRSAVIAARAVMPDDYSRRAKLHVARKIWDQSVPVTGSIAEAYFRQYGFVYEPGVMGHVRFNPAVLYEPTREILPALIAPVHNLEGEFVGIHKTYLASDGTGKADVKGDARRMLGKCHGSYIQLGEATGFRLVITDSLETALAIQQACPGFPVWAAMTPGNMRAPVPPSIKEIILCADGDGKNKEANKKLVLEAVREHLDRGVRVSLAQHLPGMNFSEIL
ncbi:MAG: toprim domain-containing protein [Alphaproteobacteria bacterium]